MSLDMNLPSVCFCVCCVSGLRCERKLHLMRTDYKKRCRNCVDESPHRVSTFIHVRQHFLCYFCEVLLAGRPALKMCSVVFGASLCESCEVKANLLKPHCGDQTRSGSIWCCFLFFYFTTAVHEDISRHCRFHFQSRA